MRTRLALRTGDPYVAEVCIEVLYLRISGGQILVLLLQSSP